MRDATGACRERGLMQTGWAPMRAPVARPTGASPINLCVCVCVCVPFSLEWAFPVGPASPPLGLNNGVRPSLLFRLSTAAPSLAPD